MIERRRYMGGKKKEYFTLLYHWEASDELVNNTWVDRVQGVPFTKAGSPQYEDGMWSCDADNYFYNANMNTAPTKIVLPERWKCEMEVLIPSAEKERFFIDFGSVSSAAHAFGFGLNTNYEYYYCNYKPTRNNDTNSTKNAPPIDFPSTNLGVLKTFIAGVEKIDATYSKFYIELDGIKHYGEPHIPGAYNGNWKLSSGYIGRAVTALSTLPSKIKSVKFFSDNR